VTSVTATFVLPDAFRPAEDLPFSPVRADAVPPSSRLPPPVLPPPRLPPQPAHWQLVAEPVSEHALEELDSVDLEPDVELAAFDGTMELSHRAVMGGLAAPATPFVPSAPTPVQPVAPPMVAAPAPQSYADPQHDVSPWVTGVPPSRPAPAPIVTATPEPMRPVAPAPILTPEPMRPVAPAPSVTATPEPMRPVAPTLTSEAPISQRAPAHVGHAPPKPAVAASTGASAPGAMTFGAHFLAAMELFEATSPRP
jgi:hypothetical protein